MRCAAAPAVAGRSISPYVMAGFRLECRMADLPRTLRMSLLIQAANLRWSSTEFARPVARIGFGATSKKDTGAPLARQRERETVGPP